MTTSSVVRIFATTQFPSYISPWQARIPSSSTGSGVIIERGMVLTGAHVVANATFIQVQKVSDPTKYVAHVVGICHDCDLALLKITQIKFQKGSEAAKLGELPELRDRVSVVGFPVGGEEVSITEGVVSRIERQWYSHSQRDLLAVTVDAAINSGNSGGPVFKDGLVVGIAFQSLDNAENIGEMVPVTLIRRFMEGVRRGLPLAVPGLSLATQSLENPELKRCAGLKPDQSGALVLKVEYGGSAWEVLQEGDVLMEIAGCRIADNQTILYNNRIRTYFDVVLGDHFIGDKIQVVIRRQGHTKVLEIELQAPVSLVPNDRYDIWPTFFIYGGLVFQPLTRDYLRTWEEWWDKAPCEFLSHYYYGKRTNDWHEVVVISKVLADEINVGYEDSFNELVSVVNGKRPRDMVELVALIEGAGEQVEIRTYDGSRLVFNSRDAKRATTRILKRYRIENDRSVGLIAPKKSRKTATKQPKLLKKKTVKPGTRKSGLPQPFAQNPLHKIGEARRSDLPPGLGLPSICTHPHV
jgi:S1-C subfamily serine protease